MSPLKVVHVGLGPIGLAIAEAVAGSTSVVSVAAVDPLLTGRDLGELLGGPATGVTVAAELDEALAGRQTDVALHCTGSQLARVEDQLHALIGRGLSVVSTCEELSWPWFHHPDEAQRLDAAAKAAGVRLLGTGVNPGFVMDLLPVVLSGVAARVDSVVVHRVVDASTRRVPLQTKVGAGASEGEFRERAARGALGHMGLVESVAMIAAALGWSVDEIHQVLDPVLADAPIRGAAIAVEAGQVRGLHQVATGSMGGQRKITLDLVMALGAESPGDTVVLQGEPPLEVRIAGGIHGDIATVAAVVKALPRIGRASAGLLSVLDLPAAAARSESDI